MPGTGSLAGQYLFFEVVIAGMGSLADCELPGIFVLSGDFHAALAVILASNCRGLSDLAGQYLFFDVVISGDWQSCGLYITWDYWLLR